MAYPSPIQSRQSSKAIYTARRSYDKARQSTPITDSVKAEQERQAGAASRGELSPVKSVSHSLSNRLTLSLSLKPSLSKLGIGTEFSVLTKAFTELFFWFSESFCFNSFGEGERRRRSPYCFLFFFFFFPYFLFNSELLKKKKHMKTASFWCI